MIEKIIEVLKAGGLKTREAFYNMEEGEILKAKFRDEKDYNSLLNFRIFKAASEADLVAYQNMLIPIVDVEDAEEMSSVAPVVVPDAPTGGSFDVSAPTGPIAEGIASEAQLKKEPWIADEPIKPIRPKVTLEPETSIESDAPVAEKPKWTRPSFRKKNGKLTRCPLCGRVKGKDAEYCKRCTAKKR